MDTTSSYPAIPMQQPLAWRRRQQPLAQINDTRLASEQLVLRQLSIGIPGLPSAFDGYRIAHLSDLHFGPALTYRTVMSAILVTRDLQADLVVITGDFVTSELDQFLMPDALSRLSALDGVWGVLGNHDHWTDADGVERILGESGVRILRNTNTCILRRDAGIWLAGVDDMMAGQDDLDSTLAGIPDGGVTLLMAHEPDYADTVAARGRVALQLSGHCHGGAPRIPWLGVSLFPWLVKHGRKYPYGLYNTGNMWVYASAGAGRASLPRFHGLPEVAEITLTRADPISV